MEKNSILEIKGLNVSFSTYGGRVKAVRDVSLEIGEGECVAIVGESGCGKSVTAKSVMGLIPKSCVEGGEIIFQGKDLLKYTEKQMQGVRGDDISMILLVSISYRPIIGVPFKYNPRIIRGEYAVVEGNERPFRSVHPHACGGYAVVTLVLGDAPRLCRDERRMMNDLRRFFCYSVLHLDQLMGRRNKVFIAVLFDYHLILYAYASPARYVQPRLYSGDGIGHIYTSSCRIYEGVLMHE